MTASKVGAEIEARLGASLVRLSSRLRDLGHVPSIRAVAAVVVAEGRALLPELECVITAVLHPEDVSFTALAGAGPWAESLVGQVWPLEGTLNARAFRAEAAVESDDAGGDSSLPEVFSAGGIRRGRLVPLQQREPLPNAAMSAAAISFWTGEAGTFSDDQRGLIDGFAQLASLVLLRAEVSTAAHEAVERVRLQTELVQDLQSSLEPAEVARTVLRRAMEIARADRATLSTIGDDGIRVEASDDRRGEPTWIGQTYPISLGLGQPLFARALETGRPVVGGRFDVHESMHASFAPLLDPVQHTAVIPLVRGGKAEAALVVSRYEDVAFTESDVANLQLLASVAVLAWRNAALHAEAQAAASMRGSFLNMAAHELRTPFTVVTGYISMILDGTFGDPSESWWRPLRIVDEKLTELGDLVDRILVAARLEAGAARLRIDGIDVDEVIRAVVQRARPRVEVLGGSLEMEPLPVGLLALGDRDALRTVLDNIVSNAVIHRREAPQVRIDARREGNEIVVGVSDNGRGIPEMSQSAIFDKFTRVEDPNRPTPGGTGLGLFICRSLMHQMSGEVRLASSEVEQGSRFEVVLRAAR